MGDGPLLETAEGTIGTATQEPPPIPSDIISGPSVANPNSPPARGDRHWQPCEIGMLVARAIDGRSYGAIGETLERTPRACERMLHRLLAGEHECPGDCKADLEALRKKMLIGGKAWPEDVAKSQANGDGRSNRKSTIANRQSVEELRMIGRDLAEILKLLNVLVDLGVVSAGRYVAGNGQSMEVYAEIGVRDQKIFRRISAMAAQIRCRCEKPKPVDHPFGETGPIPHVVTGQGDYAKAWPEPPDNRKHDLCGWLRRMFCASNDCDGCR